MVPACVETRVLLVLIDLNEGFLVHAELPTCCTPTQTQVPTSHTYSAPCPPPPDVSWCPAGCAGAQ
jgi:hypothetical protein